MAKAETLLRSNFFLEQLKAQQTNEITVVTILTLNSFVFGRMGGCV